MHILESFLQGKENNPLTCEDGIFISDKLVAVIDGATSDGALSWEGHRSGYYAKEVLVKCMGEMGAKEFSSAQEVLTRLDAELCESILSFGRESLSIADYPKASIILYNDTTREIISYGDCRCSINGVVYSETKRIDRLNEELRAFVLEYELLQGRSLEELSEKDPGRAAILDNLRKQCAFENVPGSFGYAVLNGRGIERSLIKTYKVYPGDEVILASDGYPRLGKDLAESEAYLQGVLQEDSLCFRKFSSTKGVKSGNVSFDDRAFCRFIVGEAKCGRLHS